MLKNKSMFIIVNAIDGSRPRDLGELPMHDRSLHALSSGGSLL